MQMKLSNYIYIHFALEKGIAKTVVIKKHAEILLFILKNFSFLIMFKEKCGGLPVVTWNKNNLSNQVVTITYPLEKRFFAVAILYF